MVPGRMSKRNGIESEVSIEASSSFRKAARELFSLLMEAAVAVAVYEIARLLKYCSPRESRPCCSTF
jgi:hypothetical protein